MRTEALGPCLPAAEGGFRPVAAHIDAAVLVAHPDESVGAVRARLTADRYVLLDPVFVLGEGRALLGAVPLATLLAADDGATIGGLPCEQPARISASATREEAASFAIRANAACLAVLDKAGAFLGVLTANSVMAILREEHIEDLHHMVGILGRSEQAKAALTAAPHRRVLFRLPWLLVGLAGSVAATGLMAAAEAELSANIALTFFIPAIVYLADAIGTQSEAVAVRGLSLTDGSAWRLLAGELGTGALMGLALAALALAGVWAAFGDLRLALAVSGALATAGTIATGIGFLLPWAFQRAGLDPAYGSGPVATVVQDMLSLSAYLLLVWLLFP